MARGAARAETETAAEGVFRALTGNFGRPSELILHCLSEGRGVMPTQEPSHFDPNLTKKLAHAFDSAWSMLGQTNAGTALNGNADRVREALAKRIVAMADDGVTDPDELSVDALAFVQEKMFPEGDDGLPTA